MYELLPYPPPPQVVIEEVAQMRRYQHPAVLPLLCSFVTAAGELWLVMPYMEVGARRGGGGEGGEEGGGEGQGGEGRGGRGGRKRDGHVGM